MPVPNQREITVRKAPTDKAHIYTANSIAALDEAARVLQTKCGFKLYMYFAKNQDKYSFSLSSADFMQWSGTGYSAYTSAFAELVENGYLVKKEDTDNVYTFYDIPQQPKEDIVTIEIPKAKVEEVRQMQSRSGFIF